MRITPIIFEFDLMYSHGPSIKMRHTRFSQCCSCLHIGNFTITNYWKRNLSVVEAKTDYLNKKKQDSSHSVCDWVRESGVENFLSRGNDWISLISVTFAVMSVVLCGHLDFDGAWINYLFCCQQFDTNWKLRRCSLIGSETEAEREREAK